MQPNQDSEEALALAFQRGDLEALRRLRSRTNDLVLASSRRFQTGPGHIPVTVLNAKADELLVDAARTYKPGTGATFRTHLFNHLRRLDRFTKANANIAHKPEARANMITNFNQQYALLADKKQRPPTPSEMADHMSIPVEHVQLMMSSQRREIPWSHGTGTSNASMNEAHVNMVLSNIRHELTPDEIKVFDYLMGTNGKKKTAVGGEIAKGTGFSQAKVSQLRTAIAKKIQPHLSGMTARSFA
jgi:DNA-directed RNA polymerase specialized sigma subunit